MNEGIPFIPAPLQSLRQFGFGDEDGTALSLAREIDQYERTHKQTIDQEIAELFEAFKLNQGLLQAVETRIRDDHSRGIRDANAFNERLGLMDTIDKLKARRKVCEERKNGKEYVQEKIDEHYRQIELLKVELARKES